MRIKRIWTKICGTTNLEDATLAWEFGADAIGFVFVERSARYVTDEQVASIINALARPIERIGVVENMDLERAVRLIEQTGLSGLQLHGTEDAGYVSALRQRLPQARLLKGVHVTNAFRLREAVAQYQDCGADALLLDSSVGNQTGGTGVRFDWHAAAEALADSGNRLPIIVAGGLDPENVGLAIEVFRPFGVDVVTGVEREKGRKDPDKLRNFIASVRAACRASEDLSA